MLKLGILLIAMAFLVGCTTAREDALVHSYQQKVDYHKQLQKTEKIQFFDNNVTTIVLTATYLYKPNFEKNDKRYEEFIIGIHFEDEGVENIVDMIGVRDVEDIQKMRDKKKQESEYVPDSLFDDIATFVGFGDAHKNDETETRQYVNNNDNKEINSTVPNYGLTLNSKKAIMIKALNKNDERLKNIAYVTEWGSYYLVTFEHTDSKQFTLIFENEKYGKGAFSFAKVAKYIYTKKSF